MNDVRTCVLGCKNADGIPYRAAPGLLVCHACSGKLRRVLDDLEHTYRELSDVDELTPGGSPDSNGGRRTPGPRSPAVDSLLVHTDPRSVTPVGAPPAALASIAGFARIVREDRSLDVPPAKMRATVPAGRITMVRECATLRFNWDWIMGQEWVDGFAQELRDVLNALRQVRRELPPVLRIGNCPTVVIPGELLGLPFDLACDATLRVRVGQDEIRCRNCHTVWPRGQWRKELGLRQADYATHAISFGVTVGTLRRWAHEDGWPRSGTRGRPLFAVVDVETSYVRRRGALPLGEAG